MLSESFQKTVVDVIVAHERDIKAPSEISGIRRSPGVTAREISDGNVPENAPLDNFQKTPPVTINNIGKRPINKSAQESFLQLSPAVSKSVLGANDGRSSPSQNSNRSQDSTKPGLPTAPNIKTKLGLTGSGYGNFTECLTDVGGGVCSVQMECSFEDGEGTIEVITL